MFSSVFSSVLSYVSVLSSVFSALLEGHARTWRVACFAGHRSLVAGALRPLALARNLSRVTRFLVSSFCCSWLTSLANL